MRYSAEPVERPLLGGPLDTAARLPSPSELARLYLRGLSLAERRAAGQVYTPPHLAEFILERAGYDPATPLEERTVLDPACGGGVFLEIAVVLLAARLESLGVDIKATPGRTRLLQAVRNGVFGVDVDGTACDLARTAVRATVERLSPGPLPEGYFDANVVQADFLLDDGLEMMPHFTGGLDFIVGNPPYVAATRLDNEAKSRLRARFVSASGRLDLYTLFIERALPLLAPGGRLAFVTPDKFLVNQSAAPLRALVLRQGVVREVATFSSHKVFAEAATVPCVTVIERAGVAAPVKVLECEDRPDEAGRVQTSRRYTVPTSRFTREGWDLTAPELLALANRVRGRHPHLGALTSRVSAGLATGLDGLYVLPTARAAELGLEPSLLRRAVRGRDLAPYGVGDPGLSIIIPYTYDEVGRPGLVNLADFPRVRAYLERERETLEERHCVRVWGKAWYDLHDPVPFDLERREKLLVPDVANFNRFSLNRGEFCPLHSAYYLVPHRVDPRYLLAVLNARPVEFLVRLFAPVVKDGFSRYRKQFLVTLPVPAADGRTIDEITSAVDASDHRRAGELVGALFGLECEDVTLVDEYLARRNGRVDLRERGVEPA